MATRGIVWASSVGFRRPSCESLVNRKAFRNNYVLSQCHMEVPVWGSICAPWADRKPPSHFPPWPEYAQQT